MAGLSPVPCRIFSVTATTLLMSIIPFVIASIIGRASQLYLPAFLANRFGPTKEPKIRQYVKWPGWGSIIVIAILIV
jgi:hypothetical protein